MATRGKHTPKVLNLAQIKRVRNFSGVLFHYTKDQWKRTAKNFSRGKRPPKAGGVLVVHSLASGDVLLEPAVVTPEGLRPVVGLRYSGSKTWGIPVYPDPRCRVALRPTWPDPSREWFCINKSCAGACRLTWDGTQYIWCDCI